MKITEKMKQAGEEISSDLIEVSLIKDMGGIGGSKTLDEFYQSCGNNSDLIQAYAEGEIESVEAIYLAMNRASHSEELILAAARQIQKIEHLGYHSWESCDESARKRAIKQAKKCWEVFSNVD